MCKISSNNSSIKYQPMVVTTVTREYPIVFSKKEFLAVKQKITTLANLLTRKKINVLALGDSKYLERLLNENKTKDRLMHFIVNEPAVNKMDPEHIVKQYYYTLEDIQKLLYIHIYCGKDEFYRVKLGEIKFTFKKATNKYYRRIDMNSEFSVNAGIYVHRDLFNYFTEQNLSLEEFTQFLDKRISLEQGILEKIEM